MNVPLLHKINGFPEKREVGIDELAAIGDLDRSGGSALPDADVKKNAGDSRNANRYRHQFPDVFDLEVPHP